MTTPNLPAHLEHLPIADLVPYARNSRTHSPEQIAQVAASIREFGFTNPVLIDATGGIIAGHGRVMAAKQIGLAQVPCIRLGHLTDAQKRAYVIADNKLALNSGWDNDLLALELRDLDALGFDLDLIGFDADELEDLLGQLDDDAEGQGDADQVPEVRPEAISKPGDVWVLGKHRVMCGDSTNPLVVEKALNGAVPHLMVTDPPYGVGYDPEWRKAAGIKGCDNNSTDLVLNDHRADWREAWALFPGDVAYVWHGMRQSAVIVESLAACDFEIRAEIVWAKEQGVISRGHYNPQHESCWYAVRKGKTASWVGDMTQTTLWKINKPNRRETGHSTQKPVECMRRPIENHSKPGDAIYEPFSGSGTTIIAAEQMGRVCHAVELDPHYVDVIVRRWQTFTGKRATHADTGQPFPIAPEA